jgi:acyl-coenzyme A thioesterase PaaI-like protein
MPARMFRKHKDKIPQWLAVKLINLWPPLLGAGIAIREADKDFRYMRIELKRSWYNSNYVGVQFGGSIYAMVDPFYMLMLMHNLGDEYIVWDKAAQVSFLKPGKSELFAEFRLEEELISRIRENTLRAGKMVFDLPVRVTNSEGELIAQVVKTLYVRRKKPS